MESSGRTLNSADLGLERVEAKMRQALGLNKSTDTPTAIAQSPARVSDKRRSTRTGDVAVEFVHRSTGANRVEIAEAALKSEREARERAEKLLGEAQATIHDLRTKLGHLTLARDEAVASLRQAAAGRQEAEIALRQALEMTAAQRPPVPSAPARAERPRVERADVSAIRRRERPVEGEPTPVKWWLSGKGPKLQ